MIGRIKGVLLEKQPAQVLLDVNGLAYEVEVPMSTLFELPDLGQAVVLHTHLVVREDAQLLYGFYELQERSLFRILIKLNGVGPKMALSILSGMNVGELAACVQRDDVNSLVKLPGVGKKTAERLIIELRDKLKEWQPEISTSSQTPGDTQGGDKSAASGNIREAESALITLGYKPQEASMAVVTAARQLEEAGNDCGIESLIRQALKSMG